MTYERCIKTPSDLKHYVTTETDNPHFFTRSTMKFFGDTMANYGLRRTEINDGVKVFELYRKKPVKHGLKSSAFFNCETLKREHTNGSN